MLSYIIVALVALATGWAAGACAVLESVRRGRVVYRGRIYFCKDTGPLVR